MAEVDQQADKRVRLYEAMDRESSEEGSLHYALNEFCDAVIAREPVIDHRSEAEWEAIYSEAERAALDALVAIAERHGWA